MVGSVIRLGDTGIEQTVLRLDKFALLLKDFVSVLAIQVDQGIGVLNPTPIGTKLRSEATY